MNKKKSQSNNKQSNVQESTDRATQYAMDVVENVITKESGIYQIANIVNGKRYIGSAVNFCQRWRQHRSHANRGVHHSAHFQAAWNKYGSDAFQFSILLKCHRNEIIDTEQSFLDKERPEYNIAKNASAPMLGLRHGDRAKELIAASKRGIKRQPEVVKAMIEKLKGRPSKNKGRKMSPEVCLKNSIAQTGKKLSEEHKLHISMGGKGTTRSQEFKNALSERMKGRKNMLGKKHSPETVAGIVARLTKHHTHNGETHTANEWGEKFGISGKSFNARLRIWGNVDRIYVPRIKG